MPNFLENHQFRVCIDIHTTFLDNPKMWILNSPETVQGCARQRALLRRASGWDRPSTADALAMGCTWRKISQRVWPIATGVAGRLIWKMGKKKPKMGGLDITIYFIHLYSFICSSIFLFIYLFVCSVFALEKWRGKYAKKMTCHWSPLLKGWFAEGHDSNIGTFEGFCV